MNEDLMLKPRYSSQSDADMALAAIVAEEALKAGAGPAQLAQVTELVFSKSELAKRVKWQDRADYRNMTIGKAVETTLSRKQQHHTTPKRNGLSLADGVICITDALPKPRDFVHEGLLVAGKPAILAGLGGSSKSMLSLQSAICVATGKPLFDLQTPKGCALVLSGEDDSEEVSRRVNAVVKAQGLTSIEKAEVERNLRVLPMVGRNMLLTNSVFGSLQPSRFADFIIQVSKELEVDTKLPIRLIVLDHAGQIHGGEFNSREDVGHTMREINRIAEETGAAVLVLAHSPKASNQKDDEAGADDVAGSAAWVDLSRTALVMRTMKPAEARKQSIPDSMRKSYASLTTVKQNYAAIGEPMWLQRLTVEGYGVGVLTKYEPQKASLNPQGGLKPNYALRSAIVDLVREKPHLTKNKLLNSYTGKANVLKASKGAVSAELDDMLAAKELILVAPTDAEKVKQGLNARTAGLLRVPTEHDKKC